jgi:hypothetical protein
MEMKMDHASGEEVQMVYLKVTGCALSVGIRTLHSVPLATCGNAVPQNQLRIVASITLLLQEHHPSLRDLLQMVAGPVKHAAM